MFIPMLADADILPESFQFLNLGWWAIHIIAIPLVFYIGYALGRRKGAPASRPTP